MSLKLGEINYTNEDVIHFPSGLFGFEKNKQFLLVKNDGSDVFYYLQSVEEESLTFILTDPREFYKDYVLDVEEFFVKGLEIAKIMDFAIVTIAKNGQEVSINLMGPILIDIKNQMGVQAISLKKNYTTKHEIKEFFQLKEKYIKKAV